MHRVIFGLCVSIALYIPAYAEDYTPGQTFHDCPNCPEMVVVPVGNFIMGSAKDERGHVTTESPQHKVSIAKPFAVGKYAVTFAEWDACVADGGCNSYKPPYNDWWWRRNDRPVIHVSWDDTQNYMAWLTKKTGKKYRLLAEAEREYVTRTGTSSPFWWGEKITADKANFSDNERNRGILPVKSFQPNPWGLYQVHGNIWEWVEDCWHDDYTGAPDDGSAWITEQCESRVIRGGSFILGPDKLRAASRDCLVPYFRDLDVGFRVARGFDAQ